MGQSPSVQGQQYPGPPSSRRLPKGSPAEQIKGLEAALAQATTNESNLKNEVEVLKASLTHALSSEREMRASALNTREEWVRVERALLEEIGVLRKELANTERQLTKVKKELRGKMVVPFVQRLIQGRGKLVEEMITLEEPPQNERAEAIEEQLLEGSSDVHVLFDGPALHHLEQLSPFTVPNIGALAFRAKLAPELAALERATAGVQRAVNAELRSAHVRASSTGSSTLIPKTTRNLRLLVVLWEAGGIEQLMNSLISVIEEGNPKMNTGDCMICTEPLIQEELVSVEGCGHTTCKNCLRGYIGARLGEKVWPILCPICMAEGGAQRKAQVITRLLVDELALVPSILRQWTDFELSQFVVPVICPKCTKPNLFELLDYNRSKILICTHGCECAWCRDCSRRVDILMPHDCGDAALDELAGARRWMRCPRPSCRVMVEKNVGCDHITCRCGMHFCYRCGLERVAPHNCPPQS